MRETSRKPDEMYSLLERLSPGTRKLEIFARTHNLHSGWVGLGNQLNGCMVIEPEMRERCAGAGVGAWAHVCMCVCACVVHGYMGVCLRAWCVFAWGPGQVNITLNHGHGARGAGEARAIKHGHWG